MRQLILFVLAALCGGSCNDIIELVGSHLYTKCDSLEYPKMRAFAARALSNVQESAQSLGVTDELAAQMIVARHTRIAGPNNVNLGSNS